MFSKISKFAFAGVVALGAFGGVAHAGTVFSSTFGGNAGVYTTIATPSTFSVDNWTVTSGSVDWIGSYWNSAAGGNSVDLQGNTGAGLPGTIQSESFATTAGDTYNVTFYISANPDGGAGITKSVNVSATNSSTAAATYSAKTGAAGTPDVLAYTEELYSFVATSSTSSLIFADQDGSSDDYGVVLSNVDVEGGSGSVAVPLPASTYGGAALFGGLIVARQFARRR